MNECGLMYLPWLIQGILIFHVILEAHIVALIVPPISLNSKIPNLYIINRGFTIVYTKNIEIPCILEAHMVALTIPPSLSIPKYLICLL